MDQFQAGDIVVLKSGGPRMTISNIGNFGMHGEHGALCVWFDETEEPKERVFDLAVLLKH